MQINVAGSLACTDAATASLLGTLAVSGTLDVAAPPAPSPGPGPGPSPSPEPVPPQWTVPPQSFVEGTPKAVDLKPFAPAGFDPVIHGFAIGSADPPVPGLTTDPPNGLLYDGSGPAPVQSSVVVDIVDVPAPSPPNGNDFAVRAAGALHAQNFAAFNSAADVYNHYHVGLMASRGYGPSPKKPSDGASFDPNAFEVVTTPGHAVSGKAFRMWHGKNGYGQPGTIDNQWFCIPFNGAAIAQNPAGAYLQHAFIQATIWADSFLDYYWRLGAGEIGTAKLFIVDYFAGAGNMGEAVLTNHHNLGFVSVYANVGGYIVARALNTPVYQGNEQLNPAIDNGGTLTDQNSFERRYGPFSHGMTGGMSQSSRLSAQGNPDPDALAGVGAGYAWNRGQLTTVEVEVQLHPPRIRFWAAPYGQAPKLLGDTASLAAWDPGARDDGLGYGVGWSGLTLSNLVYTATGATNPGYPSDAYVDYSEIIISPNPVKFPGGFALP